MAKESSSLTSPLWVLALATAGYLILGSGGAFLGLAVGIFLALLRRGDDRFTEKKLAHLERRIGALETLISHDRAPSDEPEPSAQPVPEPLQTQAPEPPGTEPPPASEPRLPTPPPSQPPETAAPVTTPPPSSHPVPPPGGSTSDPVSTALRSIISFFMGGNPVVRVGMLILFFGVAFLARYAAERGWISIELRLAAIAFAAVVVFLIGWRLRERPGAYGLVLQGGAIGALYITVFAAARLYEIIPLAFAFALMLALVLASGALALIQDSRWLALFGITGGFLAPVLTSTGEGSHVMLFSYFALLNLGILGIAWFRAWRELNLAGFFFTFILGSLWGVNYYEPEYFATTEPFLILFFLFYVAIAVLFAYRRAPRLRDYVDGTLVFGVPIAAFALQASMVDRFEYGLAYSALTMALLYIGLARILWRRAGSNLRLLAEAFLALGIVFATVAVPLALDGHWTAAVWALEGAALVWIGVRQARRLPRVSGVLLQFAAGIAFIDPALQGGDQIPVLNSTWLGSVMVAMAGLFTAWYLQRSSSSVAKAEAALEIPFLLWGLAWWTGAGLVQIGDHVVSRDRTHAAVLFFAASVALVSWVARRLAWRSLALSSIALLPVLWWIFLFELVSRQYEHPLQDWGALSWPIGMLAAFVAHRLVVDHWPERLLALWQAGAVWLFTALTTWELGWAIETGLGASTTWTAAVWGATPALVLLALARHHAVLRWPLDPARVRWVPAALSGFGVFVLAWFILAALRSGDPWPLPYLPVLNPLDLTQLLAGMAVIRLLAWWRARAPESVQAGALQGLGGLILFYWLNVVMTRAVHFLGGVAWDANAISESTVWQSSASLLWTTTALAAMVTAARRGSRPLWAAGAVLLAIVVAKLFFVDLSGAGTVGRIVSFLGVGVLMLVIGFFSPLPPQTEPIEEKQAL